MFSVWQFLVSGGIFMFFIMLCSLVSVGVIVFKALDLRQQSVMPRELVETLSQPELGGNQLRQAISGKGAESTLARITCALLANRSRKREDVGQSVQAAAREEVIRLERGIAVLEVIITIAPLLGLLGTVSGLVSVFGVLGSSVEATPNPTELALGISEALNTTIAGLAVAIYTVIAHSYFTKKVERFAVRMESIMGQALSGLYASAISAATAKSTAAR